MEEGEQVIEVKIYEKIFYKYLLGLLLTRITMKSTMGSHYSVN